MATSGQLTGMAGLYLCAAELSRRGFIASPTSRSAQGADLLVTDRECKRAYSIQVKSNASTFSFWLMGEKNLHMKSRSLVYVFAEPTDTVQDALAVAKATNSNTWYQFDLKQAENYRDNWCLFDKDPDAHS